MIEQISLIRNNLFWSIHTSKHVLRKRNISLILGIVAVTSAIIFAFVRNAPSHDGKTVIEWSAVLTRDMAFNGGLRTNSPAAEAIRTIGTNGIADLLDRMENRHRRMAAEIQWMLNFQRIHTFQFAGRRERSSEAAANAFLALGSAGRPALPILTNWLGQPEQAPNAALALVGIGEEGIPFVVNALTNEHPRIRHGAVRALRFADAQSPAMTLQLIKLMGDEQEMVRNAAAQTLGTLGGEVDTVLPILIEGLKHPDQDMRTACAMAVRRFGGRAASAIPAMTNALQDPVPRVRAAAASALGAILASDDARAQSNADSELLAQLAGLSANDPERRVRREAAMALERLTE